jgi:hypothetical protein
MFVKRKTFETLMTDKVRNEATQDLVGRLEREVTYWRERFEAEQARADRTIDAHFATGGIAPVSNVGIAETKATAEEMKAKAERVMQEFAEIGRDDDGEPFEELRIDPDLMAKLTSVMNG